ncbi:MAG: TonB-dependent receptor [Proteobacteria bacterium]|nr:TonB-dependent receptor [Pseudomonadota bacterium]
MKAPAFALCTLALAAQATAQPSTDDTPLAPPQVVEIIGAGPLPGQGVDRNALPYTTTVIRRDALQNAQAQTLTDHLARHLPGVQINDVQGSPFQSDLTFRGYRASGLMGAAQGLSVYLDGVRINEPFGDVVNWDMLPEFAIDSVAVTPGANPVFGLNTLGAALVFTSATGKTAPGVRAELGAGRFGRLSASASHGGAEDGWDHYIGVSTFREDGWRDHSDGRLAHLSATLGREIEGGDIRLRLLVAGGKLIGNGLVPLYTIDEDDGATTPDLGMTRRSAIYTHPDETDNRVVQLSLASTHELGGQRLLETLAYVRHSRRDTINGDEAEEGPDEDDEDGDDALLNATFNRTHARQRGGGLAVALSGSGAHQWQVGASLDASSVRFEQTTQASTFDATRGVQASDEPVVLDAQVSGRSHTASLYASDTWRVAAATHLTGALRYNHTRVSNRIASVDDDTGVFTPHAEETFTYDALSPALGVAHQFSPQVTAFANLARNTRVPTVIELGCADPEQPCRLPAGLQADPYLKPVVATHVEGGLRLNLGPGARGSVTLWRTNNRDDILFRSVSVTGQQGYFENFARTRHQGLDAQITSRLGDVELSAGYSFLDATYQAHGVLRQGERNVAITPGMRIAGLARQQLKLGADWLVGGGWRMGGDVQAVGPRGVAGNEDGLLEDDGLAKDVRLPGYAIVNLRTSYKPPSWRGVEFFGQISNVFDRGYANFGALAETQFDAQGAWAGDEHLALFAAPGAPRAWSVGVRMRW